MKTDQEWVASFSKPDANWIQLVRDIQLDAMKEGMRRAAEIVENYYECPTSNEYRLQEAILTAAEQLTLT